MVTPGGACYLTECPPSLRATNINHWLARAVRTDHDGNVKPRQVTLRTRQTASGRDDVIHQSRRRAPVTRTT